MRLLEERILEQGQVRPGNVLKVDWKRVLSFISRSTNQ